MIYNKILSYIKSNKRDIFVNTLFCGIIIIALFDGFHHRAMSFIETSFSFSLSGIGIVAALKIISGALPLTDGIVDVLDRIFNFLFYANILIGLQYILLLINEILVIKIILIVLFFLRFVKTLRKIVTKLLVIFLFFNPGLNAYINLIEFVSKQSNMVIDENLNVKMKNIKNIFGIPSTPQIEEIGDARSGISKVIGMISVFTDNINSIAKDVGRSISNPIDTTKKALDTAKSEVFKSMQVITDSLSVILNMTIKFMLNSFFLFFVMPFIYFYCLYKVIKTI